MQKFTWYHGDCFDLIKTLKDQTVDLVLTSPPYNIGKEYKTKTSLDDYLSEQQKLIRECKRLLQVGGSVCWQTGNHLLESKAILPLDTLLYPVFISEGFQLRNRVVWSFGHGLHSRRRFSGRYEVVNWYTLSDNYLFNLDPVRVPQKYPHKRFYKGPKKGQISSNPLGKNPGDVWEITNIKHRHPEKIPGGHPCQFPLSLAERLILALTNPGGVVFDPFGGVATTLVAALKHGRQAIGAEINERYHSLGEDRLQGRI